jgi:GTP-binding protein LepA
MCILIRVDMKHLRNFCIIAHIDHGKTTMSDRFIERSDLGYKAQTNTQMLDSMDLEKERGITIKMHPIRLQFKINNEEYIFHIIDTPGHVDFNYEVSKSLAACEGAILIVDASQGVEAQTVANTYLAIEHDLTIIPVINKIDLPHANIDATRHEIMELLGIEEDEILLASAKDGRGMEEILQAIIQRIPPPRGSETEPLKALIFDSHFDTYQGVVSHICVLDGTIEKGKRIKIMSNQLEYETEEVGFFRMGMQVAPQLKAGEVGYFTAIIREAQVINVGDTVTSAQKPTQKAFPGYRKSVPMVFSGIYPINPNDYDKLKDSLEKLKLTDPAFHFEQETSAALGYGFRCGYLGLLHMEIVSERIRREYGQELITTAPSVVYRFTLSNDEQLLIENPSKFPERHKIKKIEEPIVKASIITPSEYIGPVMEASQQKRGQYVSMDYLSETRVSLQYVFPLAEIIIDFYDQLKSVTKGYASLDYEFSGYREEKIVLVSILVNGSQVDALSFMTVESQSYYRGKAILEKLRKLIPRQMFQIALQAAVGGKIISRENIVAYRKDVTSKCYGGDITRKRKLLEKQKEGKKRMKMIGSVEIPQEAFMSILKI